MVPNKDEVLLTPFFLSSDHDDDFNYEGKVFKYLYRPIIDSVGLAGKEILYLSKSIRALTGHFNFELKVLCCCVIKISSHL